MTVREGLYSVYRDGDLWEAHLSWLQAIWIAEELEANPRTADVSIQDMDHPELIYTSKGELI